MMDFVSCQSSFHPVFWMHHNNIDRFYEQYILRPICIHNNVPQFAPDFGSKLWIYIPRSRYILMHPDSQKVSQNVAFLLKCLDFY